MDELDEVPNHRKTSANGESADVDDDVGIVGQHLFAELNRRTTAAYGGVVGAEDLYVEDRV